MIMDCGLLYRTGVIRKQSGLASPENDNINTLPRRNNAFRSIWGIMKPKLHHNPNPSTAGHPLAAT